MVIGLGSGQTAGIVGLFPFKEITLVDLSPGVVEASRQFYGDLNLGVLNDPRMKVHIADGRHYLFTLIPIVGADAESEESVRKLALKERSRLKEEMPSAP